MTQRQFFTQLSLLSAFVAGLFLALHQFTHLATYQDFSWLCMAVFIVFSIIVFLVGKKQAQDKNPNVFTRLMLSVTFGKMFLAVILVFTYHKTAHPQERSFLLPFFLVYLFYTIYEVYFMTKLGKEQ